MAEYAVVAHRNMRRIGLRVSAGRVDTVVAGVAAIRSHRRPVMVDIGIGERRRVVAGCAIPVAVLVDRRRRRAERPGIDVIREAVVAGHAIRRNPLVAECRRNECIHRVAELAVLLRRQMARALDLQHCRQELLHVAALAAPRQALVHRSAEDCRLKGNRGIVTAAAFIQCRDVIHRLG